MGPMAMYCSFKYSDNMKCIMLKSSEHKGSHCSKLMNLKINCIIDYNSNTLLKQKLRYTNGFSSCSLELNQCKIR